MSAASMFLKFGYTFFVLIMLAHYTSNLTNVFLTGKTPQYSVESMDSANTNGQKICSLALNSVATTLLKMYPNVQVVTITPTSDPQGTLLRYISMHLHHRTPYPKQNLVTYLIYTSSSFRALKEGQCDGALLYLSDWLSGHIIILTFPFCNIPLFFHELQASCERFHD